MKKIIAYTTGFLIASLFYVNTVYNYNVPAIEGGIRALSVFQGKKIMIVTLPITQSAAADSLLYSLDTIATAHAASLKIIAVPAFEDGYTAALKQQLQTWYRSKLSAKVIVTNGMYTRKTSGNQQHPLFKWLTKLSENEQFNIDVTGPGSKFFTTTAGELYGVLSPQSKMYGASVQRTLRMQ
jgi:glutathione peroxidase-family protein